MKTKYLTTIQSIMLASTLALHPSIVRAQSPSPSELLEKGIYAEETKGDLEVAITIYQQLITESKAHQNLAAQAQFRIAQCLLKQKRQNEAIAALEKLIHDFPNEKALIAKAREHLPGDVELVPVPWADGERLQMTLTLPAGMVVGTMELRADLVEVDGRKAWRVGRRMSGGGHMLSSVDVDPENFHPVASYWKHTLLGAVSAVFKNGEVEMRREGGGELVSARPAKTVYDNEQVMHMLRRLPLEVGYKSKIPVITTLGGGAVLPIGIDVPKKESVDAPAGKFDCFKVTLDVGQSFWISDDKHRYLVKFDAGGAHAHLSSITHRKAGTPVSFADNTLGVSFTAPADWVIQPDSKPEKSKTVIHLLDPAADAEHVVLEIFGTDSIPAAARQSPRAMADHSLRENLGKELQDLKVRPNSWKPILVAGRAAVSCHADFKRRDKAMVLFAVYSVGPNNSETFVLACEPEKLEGLQKSVEQIIATYRAAK